MIWVLYWTQHCADIWNLWRCLGEMSKLQSSIRYWFKLRIKLKEEIWYNTHWRWISNCRSWLQILATSCSVLKVLEIWNFEKSRGLEEISNLKRSFAPVFRLTRKWKANFDVDFILWIRNYRLLLQLFTNLNNLSHTKSILDKKNNNIVKFEKN